jgi:hypothetical protein
VVRDIQVRHPDGRIWHVSRRWARRRPPWRRVAGPTAHERQHQWPSGADAEPVLTDDDLPGWPATVSDVVRDLSGLVGLPTLPGLTRLSRLPGSLPLLVTTAPAVTMVWLLLAWVGVATHAMVAWLVDHPVVLAGATVVLVILAVLLVFRRPWLVVAERQGLADAPRRAWRLVGWRRSGRFALQIAQAIRDGRFDASGVVVVSSPQEPRSGR